MAYVSGQPRKERQHHEDNLPEEERNAPHPSSVGGCGALKQVEFGPSSALEMSLERFSWCLHGAQSTCVPWGIIFLMEAWVHYGKVDALTWHGNGRGRECRAVTQNAGSHSAPLLNSFVFHHHST